MISGITLGGYALEPAPDVLAGRDDEWYAALASIDGATGLEIPYRGGLHPQGAGRLARLLPDGWHIVITMLPPTMAGLRASAAYGLSSTDDLGRDAALADVKAALAESRRVADATGRSTVRAIYLTSAPRGTGTAHRLAESLEELAADADGVHLLVEHCDRWREDRPVEKGFLPIEAETEAVLAARKHSDATYGQVVNWGRSVLEARSTTAPPRQLASLSSDGTLSGLVFSGTSETGGPLGAPWADAHNPVDGADPSSLLTAGEIERTLTRHVANELEFLGVKVQDPERSEDFGEHLRPLRETVAAVRARLSQVAA